MKSNDPITSHTRSKPVRNTTVSPARRAIEDHMQANLMDPICSHRAARIAGVAVWKANNILGNLTTDGKIRHAATTERRKAYVWKTSPLRLGDDASKPGVVGPRQVDVMAGTYSGAELRPFEGRSGAMDAYGLPSRGAGA